MLGLIAEKVGMTRIISDKGNFIPVTMLYVPKNLVLQKKTREKDNTSAVVLSIKPFIGKGKKSKTKQFKIDDNLDLDKGKEISVEVLENIDSLDVTSTSKGKGFLGVVKRYDFAGGRKTHGGKYIKAPGSIGTRKPRRTKRGQKMPGHTGDKVVTRKEVPIISFDKSKSIVLVKGAVAGSKGSVVYLTIK